MNFQQIVEQNEIMDERFHLIMKKLDCFIWLNDANEFLNFVNKNSSCDVSETGLDDLLT